MNIFSIIIIIIIINIFYFYFFPSWIIYFKNKLNQIVHYILMQEKCGGLNLNCDQKLSNQNWTIEYEDGIGNIHRFKP